MSTYLSSDRKKVTVTQFQKKKEAGEPIAMLTAYDYTLATLVDQGGIDAILVGDSAANVMAGYGSTLPITLDRMIYHAECVVRGVKHALVVADLPFGTYQGSPEEALRSAVRMMKEGGVDAVKLEGGREIEPSVRMLITAGIPVMGHLGLTPQSVHMFGGYSVRAKEEAEAEKLKEDALLLQELGCFSLVLEKIPAGLAAKVSHNLRIPVIGIGAGSGTDGQVLVLQDMLGMTQGFAPKFLRKYAEIGSAVTEAVARYTEEVKARSFPSAEESY